MKTAVEWFAKELYDRFEMKGDGKVFDDLLNQAKEMEKEQTKQFVIGTYLDLKMKNHGLPHGMEYYNLLAKTEEDAEQYYNETFKSE